MSQQVQHLPSVHVGLSRRAVAWLVAALVLVAVIASVVIIASNSGGGSTPAARPASSSIGGPNETLRGQAVAQASGSR